MNLQLQRILHACDVLKLPAIATEWSAMADRSAAQGNTFADLPRQFTPGRDRGQNAAYARSIT